MAESPEETLTCISCSSSTTVKNSLQDGHYFINLPLKDQLKDILENQGMHDVCSVDRSRHVINYTCDGTICQTLKSRTGDFFKPFVKECTILSQDGFSWKHPDDQSEKHMKVHPLCCVCDAVARPLLQTFKQFNGQYGCGTCLHPGMQVTVGEERET